jgi:hypothetical protein
MVRSGSANLKYAVQQDADTEISGLNLRDSCSNADDR